MKITKIADFTEEEVTSLSEAGKLLGVVAKDLEAGEYILGESSEGLVAALKDVLARIVK